MEKYKLIKQIGRGTNGEVWLVKGTSSQKQYVLKQINLQHISKREQRAAHLEVKLLSTLKHPNIVSYLDSFYNSKGSLFIVMGYCENGDLYTHIRNQNGVLFPEKQIIEWLIQICMALKYLHDRKILHRDLKTKNIFLTRSKLIKIGDLGIARVLDGTSDMATTLIGTPYYMSPEILSSKPYNHKSDVWALGCCVYEMASLKHAFNARNLSSLIQKILQGKVTLLSEQYSSGFFEIIASMLSHNPEDRPSVTEILLNSYIRSHIIKFLEETKNSSKIEPEKCSKLLRKVMMDDRDTSGDDSKNQDGLPFKDNVQENKQYTVDANKIAVAIPDINGNGDGNDNSQYKLSANSEGEIIHETKEPRCLEGVTDQISNQEVTCSSSKSNEILEDTLLKNHDLPKRKWAAKSTRGEISFDFQKINISSNDQVQHLRIKNKNTEKYCCPHKHKPKYANNSNGQISLKFLQNLTYTIMKSSSLSYTQLSKASEWKSNLPFIDAHVPTLLVSVQPSLYVNNNCPVQLSQPVTKLKSLNFNGNEMATKENVRCPKILCQDRNEPKLHKNISNSNGDITSNKCLSEVAENNEKNLDKNCTDSLFPAVPLHTFPVLNESCSVKSNNIDGHLLQQIITCGIKRSLSKTLPAQSNLSARQRRREQLCKETRSSLMNSEFGNLPTKGRQSSEVASS